ncbi:hypothetical protein HanIR_Chr10g0458981 [Helianthus annuus]|nr:hypothetical protein HanIR_Chr10g0458981 [Helianthus annuus]
MDPSSSPSSSVAVPLSMPPPLRSVESVDILPFGTRTKDKKCGVGLWDGPIKGKD